MPPVIALLTDFGLRDHYVGSMKGVMLGICSDAALVDITHDIPPQDVSAGALELASCWRYFPSGTVFLAVVDPGVGSARRPIAAAAGGYHFVAPDNGLLAPVFEAAPPSAIVQLRDDLETVRGPGPQRPMSRTFEGRDRFAPAAAWLARGGRLQELGSPVQGYEPLALPVPTIVGARLAGEVIRVDRFGNLVTNIDRRTLDEFGRGISPAVVRVGERRVGRVVATYSDVDEGEACALIGSTDHLEIAVNRGSAAQRFAAGRGTLILVEGGER